METILFNEDNLRYFKHIGLSRDTESVTNNLDVKTCYYLAHRLLRTLKKEYDYDACVILCPFDIKYYEKESGRTGLAGGVTNRSTIYMPTTLNSYKDFVNILAHEYMHVIQWNKGMNFKFDNIWADRDHEIEANDFSKKFMLSYKI